MLSIRSTHLEAFEKVLKSANDVASPWKVLIFDKFSRDVVSTLALGKRTLWRDHNVTLKMLIDSNRLRIADVTAVYVILPTDENISLVVKDVADNVYDTIHLHFVSPISKESLERLAREVSRTNNATCIAKVWDQYMGFVSLEKNLFSLHVPRSFLALNSVSVRDEDVLASLNQFATGLTNVLVSLGRFPIIRCERTGPGKELAEMVNLKLHQLVKSPLFSGQDDVGPRPLLLILDRGSDMCSPLQHSDSYQALVDDLLGPLQLNRLEGKDFALDPEVDEFWNKFGRSHIQEAITEQIAGIKEVDDMQKRMGSGGNVVNEENASAASMLMDAVNALPELAAKKKSLETHGNLLRNVFEVVKKRKIHEFPELEARLATSLAAAKSERSTVFKLIGDVDKDMADKLRLAVIYAFAAKLNLAEMDEVESTLNCGTNPEAKEVLAYAKRVLSVLHGTSQHQAPSKTATGTTGSVLFSTVDFALNQFQDKLQTMASSVKGSSSWGPASRAVDAVCGGTSDRSLTDMSVEVDLNYLYFDAKQGVQAIKPTGSRIKGPFAKCIVFVVGGGCYTEYRNLMQYGVQRKRDILYGATEMLSPNEFLKQLRA